MQVIHINTHIAVTSCHHFLLLRITTLYSLMFFKYLFHIYYVCERESVCARAGMRVHMHTHKGQKRASDAPHATGDCELP